MPKIRLNFGLAINDRTAPLADGRVTVDGVDLYCTSGYGGEIYWRMFRFKEFDACDLSTSSLLAARSKGWRLKAIPVLSMRTFFHCRITVNANSGIREPADLVGKRFGIPEYQMSQALWIRGILQHEFGVPPEKVNWFVERSEELSHGGATGFRPPKGVTITQIPRGKDLSTMLLEGELDATAGGGRPSLLDRSSRETLRGAPKVRSLFEDPMAEAVRYYKKTGLMPFNHMVAIREEMLEQHPWVALNLHKAFEEAKRVCYREMDERISQGLMLGREALEKQSLVFGADPWPYGVRANRKSIETMIQYSFEQGLTPEPQRIEDLMAPSTLDL